MRGEVEMIDKLIEMLGGREEIAKELRVWSPVIGLIIGAPLGIAIAYVLTGGFAP